MPPKKVVAGKATPAGKGKEAVESAVLAPKVIGKKAAVTAPKAAAKKALPKAPKAAAKKAAVTAPKKKAAPKAPKAAAKKAAVAAPKAAAKKSVRFDAAAPVKSSGSSVAKKQPATPAGVVLAKKAGGPSKKAAKKPTTKRARDEKDDDGAGSNGNDSDDDDSSSSDDEEDNLSDLADGSSSDDEDDTTNDKQTGKKAKMEYSVVVLRHLPQEFQEPELYKFLNQFGARVTNCFCVRSKRTHESKGTAYVQFDNEAVLPVVVEECNGMALGGRTVRARIRVLHRPMPTKPNIRIRRLKGARHAAHGPLLNRHNVSEKPIAAQLIKYSRSEKKNNEALKALGIDFSSHAFEEQLQRLPRDLMLKKKDRQEVAQVARLQRETLQQARMARLAGGAKKAAAPAPKKAVKA